jgi:hypothetical protein
MSALIAPAVGAIGSIAGGYLSSRTGNQETKMQKTQRKLIDELINSLGGEGKYAGLYATDENAFQKSFVDPSKARFNNQIAPQIQQNSIYGGQQRGTGLDDQLLRAGVDLDQLLNEQYMNFVQGAQNRQQSTIGSILSHGSGAPNEMSSGTSFMQGAGGYLSSPAFANLFKNSSTPQSKGFNSGEMNRYGSMFNPGF